MRICLRKFKSQLIISKRGVSSANESSLPDAHEEGSISNC